MNEYNRKWIRSIWNHQQDQRKYPSFERVSLWTAVQATIALLLDRWEECAEVGDYYEWPTAAWQNIHTAEHYDFGTYHAWDTLAVKGFRVVEWSDSSI